MKITMDGKEGAWEKSQNIFLVLNKKCSYPHINNSWVKLNNIVSHTSVDPNIYPLKKGRAYTFNPILGIRELTVSK